jgi:hypothetical protein
MYEDVRTGTDCSTDWDKAPLLCLPLRYASGTMSPNPHAGGRWGEAVAFVGNDRQGEQFPSQQAAGKEQHLKILDPACFRVQADNDLIPTRYAIPHLKVIISAVAHFDLIIPVVQNLTARGREIDRQ